MIMKTKELVLVFIAIPLLMGAIQLGNMFLLDNPGALPTCAAETEGAIVRQAGASSGNPTKICVCRSDGAAAYQWCKLEITGAESVVCAGGGAGVCP